MNTTEKNKLIALFMGYIDNGCSEEGFLINPNTNYDEEIDELKFHSDWNYLMQVVEKIESLNFVVQVHLSSCFIKEQEHFINGKGIWRGKSHAKTKIEAVYNACVTFIEWYNKQK